MEINVRRLFVTRYAELLVSQFRTAVLDHLPETQQGLDDEVPSMPSMSRWPYVFTDLLTIPFFFSQ